MIIWRPSSRLISILFLNNFLSLNNIFIFFDWFPQRCGSFIIPGYNKFTHLRLHPTINNFHIFSHIRLLKYFLIYFNCSYWFNRPNSFLILIRFCFYWCNNIFLRFFRFCWSNFFNSILNRLYGYNLHTNFNLFFLNKLSSSFTSNNFFNTQKWT